MVDDEQDVEKIASEDDAAGASVEGPEDHHPVEDPGHTQDLPAVEASADEEEEELPAPSLSPGESAQAKMVAASNAFAARHRKATAKRIDSER